MSSPTDLVTLSLAIDNPSFRPGETVTALLHASTSHPEHVELQDMEIVFSGIERVDTSWVSPEYRRGVNPINLDKRRVQRHVVQSKLQATTQGTFNDSNLRRFLIRFMLPSWLPPSFKGIAVRYSYLIEASVNYFSYAERIDPDAPPEARSLKRTPITASVRLPLRIWPHRDFGLCIEKNGSVSSINIADSGDSLGGIPEGGSNKGDAFPVLRPDEVPLKCWEVGPGTTVEDAIGHIIKLGTGMTGNGALSESHHYSPRLQVQQQRDGGSGRLTSDAGSEISHEDASVVPSEKSKQSSLSMARQITSEAERPVFFSAAVGSMELPAGNGGPRTFSLRIENLPLVVVCIHPPLTGSLKPGVNFAGTLEFPSSGSGGGPAPLRCMMVTVLLETEEKVEKSWQPARRSSSGNALRRVHDEYVEVTADTACTHFVFSLSPEATPTFETPLVSMLWVLRFLFVAQHVDTGRMEQLTWTLPIYVTPPT